MKTASWVILILLAAAILIVSGISVWVAYGAAAQQDQFGVEGPTVADVAAWNPEVATAIRARRGTASAFSAAYATLLLFVVAVPYRRGERWAWWAVLVSILALACLTLVRVAALGTTLGAATGATLLGVALLGLLLDVRRLWAAGASAG